MISTLEMYKKSKIIGTRQKAYKWFYNDLLAMN